MAGLSQSEGYAGVDIPYKGVRLFHSEQPATNSCPGVARWRRSVKLTQPVPLFDVARLDRGDYRLTQREAPRNDGIVDWLRACPDADFFVPIHSESTDRCEVPG